MLGVAALLALISNHVQTVFGAAFFSLASNRSYRLKDGSALPLITQQKGKKSVDGWCLVPLCSVV
jgi:hypothetical protein